MSVKEKLHRLIEELPESRWEEARQYLENLLSGPDDDPLTPEELAEIEEARQEIRRGEFYTLEQIKRENGL